MADPRAPFDCILFATADWDDPYWTNKQHTAARLARRGVRVLYVESVGLRAPRASSRRDMARLARRLWKGLHGPRQVAPGVWVLSPLMIPGLRRWPWARGLNRWLLRTAIGLFVWHHAFRRPVIWTYHPYMLDAMPARRGALVYHCVDDLASVPGVDAAWFRTEEDKLLRAASVVFTTAPSLQARCVAEQPNTHCLPNVADFDLFATAHDKGAIPDDLASIPSPRIVYVGVLSDFKVDFALIDAVARQRPDWHWVLIGEEREGQRDAALARLCALPNVHRLGYRPHAALPSYLRGADVGTLPQQINDYTRGMFPMKYYEYLAAGVPVVATRLDFTRMASNGLETGDDVNSFIAAIDRQLKRGRLTRDESEAAVADNTWDRRLDRMMALIAEVSA